MKKTFLSIAILASSIFAYAATNTPSRSADYTEQAVPAKPAKDDKNGKKADRKGSAYKGTGTRENHLFEGLNLTDNQKERLAALREKNRTDRNSARKNGKERNGNFTPEQRKQMKTDRISERRAFLAGVKDILTPEQYVTFLENSFSSGRDDHKMHKAHRSHHKKQGHNNTSSTKKGNKSNKNRS